MVIFRGEFRTRLSGQVSFVEFDLSYIFLRPLDRNEMRWSRRASYHRICVLIQVYNQKHLQTFDVSQVSRVRVQGRVLTSPGMLRQ